MSFIKVIDCNSPNIDVQFAKSIHQTGFAVLKNAPLSSTLIENTYSEWKHFFESKGKHVFTHTNHKESQAGYFPFRTENAKDSNKKDLKEFYHYYQWFQNPGSTSKFTPELIKELYSFSKVLLSWIDYYTPENIRKKFPMPLEDIVNESPNTLLRIVYYPKIENTVEAGALRAAPHEGINMITLLPSAEEAGLEVMDKEGKWHEVPYGKEYLVINIGDMLRELSQNFYQAATHQVKNPTNPKDNVIRMSMPYFVHARPEIKLSEKYTAESYLNERLHAIGLK